MNVPQWVLLLAGVGALVAMAFMVTTEFGLAMCGVLSILGAFLAGE